MTLPNHIINKLHAYHKHTVKAEKLRVEIEKWFISKWLEKYNENDSDLPITDVLIDSSLEGFDDVALKLLEDTLK